MRNLKNTKERTGLVWLRIQIDMPYLTWRSLETKCTIVFSLIVTERSAASWFRTVTIHAKTTVHCSPDSCMVPYLTTRILSVQPLRTAGERNQPPSHSPKICTVSVSSIAVHGDYRAWVHSNNRYRYRYYGTQMRVIKCSGVYIVHTLHLYLIQNQYRLFKDFSDHHGNSFHKRWLSKAYKDFPKNYRYLTYYD